MDLDKGFSHPDRKGNRLLMGLDHEFSHPAGDLMDSLIGGYCRTLRAKRAQTVAVSAMAALSELAETLMLNWLFRQSPHDQALDLVFSADDKGFAFTTFRTQ